MTRRGFTLLEVALAALLGSFILAAALGMFGLMERQDVRVGRNYDDTAELARCHQTLRRAMQTLVAAPGSATTSATSGAPEEPESTPAPAEADQEQDQGEESETRNGEDNDEGEGEENEGDRRATRGQRVADSPRLPHFLMRAYSDEDEAAAIEVGEASWRLEVVLTTPPIAMKDPPDGYVRGAFDIMRVPSAWGPDYDTWSLQWTPIDPPGEPVVLARDLTLALMAALPREGDQFTARLTARDLKEFPRAVRMILWTAGGRKTDWLFEPGVTSPDS